MSIPKNVLITLFLFTALFAETHITGDITGMTFESGGNPYIVEQDILIPEGNKAVIKKGCVFLFKPFTGLSVHGHLIVEGSQEQPVLFTSMNDGEFNPKSEQLPNPFDWNGILVTRESGTVSMKNFSLRFSVYGIKSQNTNIQIDNGLFRQNGQFHFTINDKIQFVQDNIAFSYNGADTDDTTGKKAKKPPKPKPEPSQEDGSSKAVKIVRYSSLGVGIAGTIVGVIFGFKTQKSYTQWVEASNNKNPTDYTKFEEEFTTNRTGTIISSVIGGAGLVTFGITFFF